MGKAARLKRLRKEAKEMGKGLGKGYAQSTSGTVFACSERRIYQCLKDRRQHLDPKKARKGIKLLSKVIPKVPFEVVDPTSRRRLKRKAKIEKQEKGTGGIDGKK